MNEKKWECELKDELWFIEFGRGAALPTTPEETSPAAAPRDAKRQQRANRPRRGLSLDRLLPAAARPPLPHASTVAVDAPRRPRRDRPPLRRSFRLEDDDAAAADERRRVFGRGPRAPSFDEGDVSDEHDECECGRSSLERSGPSAEAEEEDEYEPEFATSPPYARERAVPAARAGSSDRALTDAPPPRGPARAHSQGVFERRLPRIYKFGLMDKSKRASSSALYERAERSPTEAFYNATGSTRLSSQELFEKFCSEEFTSLYGREEDRRRRPPHSKSTGSSGSDVRHERTCCKRPPLGSQPALGRRHVCHAPRSDRSTDSEDTSPRRTALRPLPLDPDADQHEMDDCSRSAPLLSPDRFEARFTFDISERSEVTSNRDETPSDATETRNLTLYEEPHSDRTSLCELYDAAFSSHRPSFRRDGSKRRAGPVDLTTLDFRAIDDESPRNSRRTSQRSVDDTMRQNSETRSWASDSVFTTPERRAADTSPSSSGTQRSLTVPGDSPPRADSAAADSTVADTTIADTTVVEEEPASVIERAEYALALRLGRIELDDEISERAASTPAGGSARLSSRPSMHKLEPIEPERLWGGGPRGSCSEGDAASVRGAAGARRRRGASEPRRSARCFPLWLRAAAPAGLPRRSRRRAAPPLLVPSRVSRRRRRAASPYGVLRALRRWPRRTPPRPPRLSSPGPAPLRLYIRSL